MIATLLIATSIFAAEHKPGETCSVVCEEKGLKLIVATKDLATFERVFRGIEKGDLRPLTDADEDDSLVKIPNATFDGGKIEMFAGKVLEVIKGRGNLPDVAKIQLITESGRGKVAYVRDEYLMTALELAIHIGELEKAEKEAKESAAKLAAIDPNEVIRAIKVARIAANRAELSVRKRAYAQERSKKLTQLAKKYGVSDEALDVWIKERGIEK